MESLVTENGQIYREIEVISSDQNGLLFRHSRGIAKENFTQLSRGIREMYQPVAEVPALSLTGGGGSDEGEKTDAPVVETAPPEVILTVLIRRPVAGARVGGHPVHWHPHPRHWPSHWERFHSAHYLTNPVCRAEATNQLLRVSGWLPAMRTPPSNVIFAKGVVVRR